MPDQIRLIARYITFVGFLAILSGCGWVDSGGRQGNNDPVAPTVSVLSYRESETITIDVSSASDADGTIELYRLTLIEDNGQVISECASDFDLSHAATSFDDKVLPSSAGTFNFNQFSVIEHDLVNNPNTASPGVFSITAPPMKQPVGLRYSLFLRDNDGGTSTSTVIVCLDSINDAPIIIPLQDPLPALEGATRKYDDTLVFDKLLDLVTDDEDITNLPALAINVSQQAAHGIVSVDSEGVVTYAHDGSETTVDSFQYRIWDGVNESFGTVSIDIFATDDPPVGGVDIYAVNEGNTGVIGSSVTSNVLNNDTDVETPNALFVSLLTPPARHQGVFTLALDGGFTYQHDGSDTLSDAFTYQLTDGFNTVDVLATINVVPINDPPAFSIGTAAATLEDTAAVAVALVNVGGASDGDADGVDDALTYLVSNDNNALFRVQPVLNPLNGDLSYEPADNAFGSAEVTITLMDTGAIGPPGHQNSASQSATITVEPVNDDPPEVTAATLSVQENSVAGAVVGTLAATDVDESPSFNNWQIVSGNTGGTFTIAPATGEITIFSNALLDFETPITFNLGVRVFDNTVLPSAIQTIVVNVTNENEAPTIDAAGPFTINENASGPVGTALTATDIDDSGGGTTVFSNWRIVSGDPSGAFTINSATGQISVADSSLLNFETTPSFSLGITVDDNGAPVATSSTATVVVNLNDVVETVSVNINSVPPATVAENTAGTFYTATATGGVGGTLPFASGFGFSIVPVGGGGAEDAASFIINSSTGALRFASSPDFEALGSADADNDYHVTVRATDNDGNTGDQVVNVSVTDVAESASVNVDSGATDSVPENTAGGVYTVTATGGVGGGFAFSISGGADATDFAINAVTGDINFVTPPNFEAPADNDTNNVYNIVVRAEDNDGNFDTQSVAIRVTDVTEPATVTVTSDAADSVPENTAGAFYTVTATGGVGAGFTFSISGGVDAGRFTIGSSSGNVRFTTPPDFEAPTDSGANNVYNIVVRARDGDGNFDTQAVAVTVTDVTEFAAVTITSGSTDNVDENTSLSFYTVMAGGGVGGAFVFSIAGADAGDFTVNAGTGELTFDPAPDFELPTDDDTDNDYEITLRATDGDGNVGVLAFTATVDDAIESSTVNITSPATDLVVENSTAPFYTVTASGGVGGDTPFDPYSFTIVPVASGGAEDASSFNLDAATGALNFILAPDFENLGSADADNDYHVTVRATDNDGNSGDLAVTVTVTDDGTLARSPLDGGAEPELLGCWNTPQTGSLSGSLAKAGEDASLQLYSLLADGFKGQVAITDSQTGEFTYTPFASGSRGMDTFDYRYDDGSGNSEVRRATVIVNQALMALGDSITQGVTDAGRLSPPSEVRTSYRLPLSESLLNAGVHVDWVGSQSFGAGVESFDGDVEAHFDWSADELAYGRGGSGGVFSWLEVNPADIVLLHAGSYSLTASTAGVAAILDEIDRWELSVNGNAVRVLVAGIVDQTPSQPDIQYFNDAVAALVAARSSDLVEFVDINGALHYPEDLQDGFHPTDTGYVKLGDTWFHALERGEYLDKCAETLVKLKVLL